MSTHADKFDSVRLVVETLKDFDPKDQEMVFRWAAESLGLPQPFSPQGATPQAMPAAAVPHPSQGGSSSSLPGTASTQNIKSFVAAKNPRSDIQFAATVAYYYQFVAPDSEKKKSITKEDLIDAYRKMADRERPAKPDLTLNNAFYAGLLDRAKKGAFSINAVGENLVAMTLPGDNSSATASRKAVKNVRRARAKAAKRSDKKKSSRSKA